MHDRELKVLCRAVGDVTRMQLVRLLARRPEMNVTELGQLLLLSQPLASWHVRILKRAGLISTRKNGRQVYCSIDEQRFAQLQVALAALAQPGAEGNEAPAEALAPSEPLASVGRPAPGSVAAAQHEVEADTAMELGR
ncbi:MAG: ArsR/SmtB family transcription factor [Chloroflexota bacterium]